MRLIFFGLFFSGALSLAGERSLSRLEEARLASHLISVVSDQDLINFEGAATEEQKAKLKPRLRELLTDSSLPKNGVEAKLLEVSETPWQVRAVNYLFKRGATETVYTYDIKFPEERRHLARVVIGNGENEGVTFELLAKRVNDELVADSEFSFQDKSFFEYFFLFVAVLVPLFILRTLFVCWQMNIPNRHLWIFLSAIGVIQYDLNWATGQIGLRPFSLIWFASKYHHGADLSPWIFSTSVPIGAILFYWKKRKLTKSV